MRSAAKTVRDTRARDQAIPHLESFKTRGIRCSSARERGLWWRWWGWGWGGWSSELSWQPWPLVTKAVFFSVRDFTTAKRLQIQESRPCSPSELSPSELSPSLTLVRRVSLVQCNISPCPAARCGCSHQAIADIRISHVACVVHRCAVR
jgi:hypothetical protein